MFYDIFCALCKKKGVSKTRATLDVGLSNATATKWKKTGAVPDSSTLAKLAVYFDVSTDFLLGLTPDSCFFFTEQRLEEIEKEYQSETDTSKKQSLALAMAELRGTLEKQKADALALEKTDLRYDSFTMAAHNYSGILSDKDKEVILRLMATMARDVKESEKGGSPERDL